MKKDIRTTCFILVGLVSFFVSSCNNKERHLSYALRLDSLCLLADSALLQLSAIDSTTISGDRDTLKATLDQIAENNTDTLSRQSALALASCSKALVVLIKIEDEFPELKRQLRLSKKQAAALSEDIKAGILEEAQVAEYSREESQRMNELLSSVAVLLEVYSGSMQALEADYPAVAELSDSLASTRQIAYPMN